MLENYGPLDLPSSRIRELRLGMPVKCFNAAEIFTISTHRQANMHRPGRAERRDNGRTSDSKSAPMVSIVEAEAGSPFCSCIAACCSASRALLICLEEEKHCVVRAAIFGESPP